MHDGIDPQKSLQELEGNDWGEPNYDSCLATTVHRLRRKPLSEFSVEDLRIMIGQRIGLPFLMPLALEILEETPLAEGDFYPGDLLIAVLQTDALFWKNHPDLYRRVGDIVDRTKILLLSLDKAEQKTLGIRLEAEFQSFDHR